MRSGSGSSDIAIMNHEVQLEERYLWPLSSATTCYSGARQCIPRKIISSSGDNNNDNNNENNNNNENRDSEPNKASCHYLETEYGISLATATHVVQIPIRSKRTDNNNNNNSNNPGTCSSWSVSMLSSLFCKNMICVGYSKCGTNDNNKKNERNNNTWEALALMDPSSIPSLDPEEDEAVILSTAALNALGNPKNTTASTKSHSMSRQPSTVSTATTTGDAASSVSVSASSAVDASSSVPVPDESSTTPPALPNDSPPTSIQACLALSPSSTLEDNDNNNNKTSFVLPLDFRPLALTCGMASIQRRDPTDSIATRQEEVPLVWCGSADSCKLYAYIPATQTSNNNDSNTNSTNTNPQTPPSLESLLLTPTEDSPDAFQYSSPVMALDYKRYQVTNNNNKDGHDEQSWSCLVVACQDGTIQIIHFTSLILTIEKMDQGKTMPNTLWENLGCTTVVVDGPAVCVHLHWNNGTLTALLGSLLGYVMCMKCRTFNSNNSNSNSNSNNHPEWNTPFLVAQGLWNSHLGCQDMITAVHVMSDETIAFGTHSGKCFLYTCKNNKRGGEPQYQLIWTCRLPYSIHGLVGWTDDDSSARHSLVVTTRKSVHWLEQTNGSSDGKNASFDTQLARQRLNRVLRLS